MKKFKALVIMSLGVGISGQVFALGENWTPVTNINPTSQSISQYTQALQNMNNNIWYNYNNNGGGSGGSASASNVSYSNTSSGLTATNVQQAIDQVASGSGKKHLVGPISASNNIEQTSGIAWRVNDNTNPGKGYLNLNISNTYYYDINGLRYYTVTFYSDRDGSYEFQIKDNTSDIFNLSAMSSDVNVSNNASAPNISVERSADRKKVIIDRANAVNADNRIVVTFITTIPSS